MALPESNLQRSQKKTATKPQQSNLPSHDLITDSDLKVVADTCDISTGFPHSFWPREEPVDPKGFNCVKKDVNSIKIQTRSPFVGEYTPSVCDLEKNVSELTLEPKDLSENILDIEQSKVTCEILDENIYFQNEDGDSILHSTLIECRPQIHSEVWTILCKTPSHQCLNIRNHLGQSALILAAHTNQPLIIRWLMCFSASVIIQDVRGNTALHIACTLGHEDCVRALTTPITSEELANITQCYIPYEVPLQSIPQDLSIKNFEGESCLHLALQRNQISILIHLLIQCHGSINDQEGRSGETLLHHAVRTQQVTLVQNLLSVPDVNVNAKRYDGSTPLRLAPDDGPLTQLLLTAHADPAMKQLPWEVEAEVDSDSDMESVM